MSASRSSRAPTATRSRFRSRRSNATPPAPARSMRSDNRAVLQQVRAGRIVGEQWQVIEGLAPGDRIVVEGFQKFEPGDVVAPVPWQATRSAAESSTSDPERSQPVPVHYSPAR